MVDRRNFLTDGPGGLAPTLAIGGNLWAQPQDAPSSLLDRLFFDKRESV
jgi:hypothetical protein